jgi:dihydrofolate reductase
VIRDPGGFGETERRGWANQYFTPDAQQIALKHLKASDYFLIGRVTYELLYKTWGNLKGGEYLDRMNEIANLVASTTLSDPPEWNATVIDGDVAVEITRLKKESGGDIEVDGSTTLVQTLMRHDLIDEYRIHVHPVILGRGTQLFPAGRREHQPSIGRHPYLRIGQGGSFRASRSGCTRNQSLAELPLPDLSRAMSLPAG